MGCAPVVPDGVPADLEFTVIWSNPPIRIGKEALHALLLQWIPRLAVEGAAYLVVQRNLGADSLHAWLTTALADEVPGELRGPAARQRQGLPGPGGRPQPVSHGRRAGL